MKRTLFIFKKYYLLLVFSVPLLVSCDAPRDNPFDPKSVNYEKPYTTRISVKSLYPPNTGISDALILIQNLNLSGVTNASGYVDWEHQKVDSLKTLVLIDGYFEKQSIFKPIQLQNDFFVLINAKPQLQEGKLISIYDNFRNQTYVSFNAQITDADGQTDIIDVVLNLNDKTFRDTLVFENPDLYVTQFNIKELPGSITPSSLPELEFSLFVENINGDSIAFEPFRIIRVIEIKLTPIQPNSESTVIDEILFKWDKVNLKYEFTYQILLYRLTGIVELVEVITNIDSQASEFLLDDPLILSNLSDGVYFWLLQVRDQAGNLCQSEILSFNYARE